MFPLGPLHHQVPLVSMPAHFARWKRVNPGRCWCIGSRSQLRDTVHKKHGPSIGAYHDFPLHPLRKRRSIFILECKQILSGERRRTLSSCSIFRDGEVLYHICYETNLILIKVVYYTVPHRPVLEKIIQEMWTHQGDYLPVLPISKFCINAWICLNI